MTMFNKIIFSLLLSLSIPAFGMEKARLVTKTTLLVGVGKSLGIVGAATASAFTIDTGLQYIASYAHEHGHGIASGDPDYKVTIKYPENLLDILFYKGGAFCMHDKITNKAHQIFTTLAGPVAGTATTGLQLAGLEAAHRYIGKSFSLPSQFLWQLKFYRLNSAIAQAIYGFLPLYQSAPESNIGIGNNGDGHEIWKIAWKHLFNNDNCPTISKRYGLLPLTTMLLSLYISWKLR